MKSDSPKPKTILLVEDDRAARKPMYILLTKAGWKVYEAASLTEAQQLLPQNPNWVILDMMLPDGDGLSLVNKLPKGTKLAVVTGVGDPARYAAIQAVKPDLFFRKPLDLQQLIKAMS